jgi:hypothetical protein
MATVDHISGVYPIAANSTPPPYTFWWPNEPPNGNQYFNVSIAPQFDDHNPVMKPLVEVKREWLYVLTGGGHVQTQLHLTLQNNNDFEVKFRANHMRVL